MRRTQRKHIAKRIKRKNKTNQSGITKINNKHERAKHSNRHIQNRPPPQIVDMDGNPNGWRTDRWMARQTDNIFYPIYMITSHICCETHTYAIYVLTVRLTSLEAWRIFERKGTMAHSTDRNQKMNRTPEDWTPCNLSNWIKNVAKSWKWRGDGETNSVREREALHQLCQNKISEGTQGKLALLSMSLILAVTLQFSGIPQRP